MQASIGKIPEQKMVTISSKRQFTIPQKFYSELGFDKEAVCIRGEGYLIIRPAMTLDTGEFDEQILEDLVAEGFSGKELLEEFRKRRASVRPAVEALLEEARAVANGAAEFSTYDDIFSSDE